MPNLREIFGRSVKLDDGKYIMVRDRKPTQCSFILPVEEAPFIRRCPKMKMHHQEVCKDHAYTVNYLDERGIERTAYFSHISKAESFKQTVNWLECNYIASLTTNQMARSS